MIDMDKARLALMLAIFDPNFPPPNSSSLLQQARKLNLVIEVMNWTDGMYSGPVVAQDDQAWLIKIGSGRAGVLAFSEIEEGAGTPSMGDHILLTLTHGIVNVVVLPSDNNASTESKRLG